MFVMTMNKSGLRKAAAVGVCAIALAAGVIGLRSLDSGGKTVDAAAAAPAGPGLTQKITGAQDVQTFLAGYGVEVDATTAQVSTVRIPRKWDDNFKAFHDVVSQSGYDLTKCKNKAVDKWVAPIPAQSNEQTTTYAVVLVYKQEPHGAYLLQKPSGEVLPLTPAAVQQTAALPADSGAEAAAPQDTAEQAAAPQDTAEQAAAPQDTAEQAAAPQETTEEVTAPAGDPAQETAALPAEDAGVWPTE